MKNELATAIQCPADRLRLLSMLNFLYFVSIPAICLAQQSLPEELTATLSLNDNLERSGAVTFIVEVRNVSAHRIVLMQERSPYESAHLKTYDRHGRRLAGITTSYVNLNLNEREMLVEIDPDQTFKISFEGTMSKDDVQYEPQTTPTPGPFIKFGNSVIQCPRGGPCLITFELEHSQELSKDLRRELREPDIWFGKVVSNPIALEVPEKFLQAE